MHALQVSLVVLTIYLFIASTSAMARESGESPPLHRVAQGGIIEVNVPFHGNSSVRFRNGEIIGRFSANSWAIRCTLNFTGNPATEVSAGRYEVTRARNQQLSLGSNDFSMVTRLTLKTLSGISADSLECTQRGSWRDVGNAVPPITMEQFNSTVGRYLTLKLADEAQGK